MRNIFILYMPLGNHEAIVHYEDTIVNKVSQERIFQYIDQNLQNRLRTVFGTHNIAVWGSRDSSSNRARFEKMQAGDTVLIVEGDTVKLLGKIAAKTVNNNLSQELWKNLRGESTEGWNLIYFIANPLEIDLPFNEVKKLFGYSMDYQLRGFTNVADDRLEQFFSQYDELYSVLQRIKAGETVYKKAETLESEIHDAPSKVIVEESDAEQSDETISDHVRMQWTLLNLGLKAGTNVWLPKNDQTKVANSYGYDTFEHEFIAGMDVETKYVQNIDVIWKEEYRIDAAFEVENSTSIYSGLLRFSDLKIVAPNSIYPLFIVAPLRRKGAVINQVQRPTFRKIEFEDKVRFLSYEAVDEINSFFQNSNEGLNVEMLIGKSESLDIR